ncbi:MAG: inositol monophosphatase [Nitrospinae bacterium]|nr:inositol monophosphatase [Nitrospinota bacterium]MBI3814060.1 inositol monophosphatase [Nitrospinota bacterium]
MPFKLEKFLNTAVEAVKEAGRIQKERFGENFKIEHKGEINLVTEIDYQCEKVIIDIIKMEYPEHEILTEEAGSVQGLPPSQMEGKYKWIIDPLDGTTNYAHNYPCFCASVGLEINGDVVAGAVYNPIIDELFTSIKGEGAYLNGKRLKVSVIGDIGRSLLATGFPYDIRESKENNLNHFCNFAVRVQAIRRAGSAVLDLCYLAAGRFDGFWEMKLNPWDMAAASLMVKEAGGMITNFRGGEFSIYKGETLASNGLIHQEMIDILKLG